MRLILTALLLAGWAAPGWSQQTPAARRGPAVPSASQTTTVWGQVRSEKTGAPLRFAIVELVSASPEPVASITDSLGIYVLREVPAGRRLLRVTHIDHAPHELEILVVPDRQTLVDFDLEFRPVRLSAVLAEGGRGIPAALDTVAARDSDLGRAGVRVLESTPGVAELGLTEAVRDIPGHEPVDPADVLYVRGGSADLKLVLLNGAPVYAPFHVGGLIHALDASVLRSANLLMGGASAKYDGGLSYIMELETRSGRNVRPRGELGLDMMSGRTLLEGPLAGDGVFLVSARSVHGLGTGAVMNGAFPYQYGDALGRVDMLLGGPHVVTASAFWNHERVQLDSVGAIRESASWGNRSGSVRYRGRLGITEVLGTLAGGQFRTLLPLGGIQPLVAEGTAGRVKLGFDFERPWAGGRVFWGATAEQVEFDYRVFPQGVSRDRTIVQSQVNGETYGGYIEGAWTVLPRLRIRGGGRADHFSDAEVHVSPRASATMLLTERAALTVSAGRYHQYVRSPERSLVFLGNVVPDSGAGARMHVAQATHVVASLSQDFGEGIRLTLDGYFKEFEGLRGDSTGTNSSGVDVWLRRGDGRVTGWLGYSLAWLWTVDPRDPRRSREFTGRQLVSAGVSGPVPGQGLLDVRVSYGAGLPYTAIPEPEISGEPAFMLLSGDPGDPIEVPSEPENPYIRVDAQLSRTFLGQLGGRQYAVMPYLRVLNALNRRDAIFYHYDRDVGAAEPVADLPVVPIFGMEVRF